MAVRSASVPKRQGEAHVGRTLGEKGGIKLPIDGHDRSQKVNHLVDDMTAKIAQKTACRATLNSVGAVLIHPAFDPPDLADPATAVRRQSFWDR